jgi:tellurite resistance protein TerC
MLEKFSYLEYSLVAILIFVGLKMILHHYVKLPEWFSLLFIVIALVTGVVVSLKLNKTEE